ncbi:hypothetical protein PR048_019829 [Dryococelus australis]|uniref:Uncharacterized protein n=1 Tax=Dryococelus australis TaxID=614101 RepID=A0ABQ9H4L5_9NEOP|nr:hypothetical protein PR048_019829 [Dryococelus australis]
MTAHYWDVHILSPLHVTITLETVNLGIFMRVEISHGTQLSMAAERFGPSSPASNVVLPVECGHGDAQRFSLLDIGSEQPLLLVSVNSAVEEATSRGSAAQEKFPYTSQPNMQQQTCKLQTTFVTHHNGQSNNQTSLSIQHIKVTLTVPLISYELCGSLCNEGEENKSRVIHIRFNKTTEKKKNVGKEWLLDIKKFIHSILLKELNGGRPQKLSQDGRSNI